MHTFQEKWVGLKENFTKTKEKWAESGSIKEKKNRPKHEHNLPRPSGGSEYGYSWKVKPPNKGKVGTRSSVLYREVPFI